MKVKQHDYIERGTTVFLRFAVLAIGVTILALCGLLIRIMTTEDVGGYLPILIGMCLAALPFFYGLYQALKLLGYIDTNQAFSELSVNALGRLKYCATGISALYVFGLPYIFIVADSDDAPGVILMALVIIFASAVATVFAAVMQKVLRTAVDMKSEHDLTV
ncbi:MAG TPA: DUF2975 domain-containing protein [Candidatus Saccharimonadales bacterium]|jgi:hypothetical protein